MSHGPILDRLFASMALAGFEKMVKDAMIEAAPVKRSESPESLLTRQRHANGCFNDNPQAVDCQVCGGTFRERCVKCNKPISGDVGEWSDGWGRSWHFDCRPIHALQGGER